MTVPEAPSLVADCEQCFALCCVLLPFSAVSGFGIDKPGGTPCPNLADDDRCSIHATLRQDGWSGCVESAKFHLPVRPGDAVAVTHRTEGASTRFQGHLAGTDQLVVSGVLRATFPSR